jgi:hypothetical protein
MFANNAAAAGGSMARAGNTVSAESRTGSYPSGAMVTATISVITKYQATERQRRVATERARAAVKRIEKQQRATAAAAKTKKTTAEPAQPGGTLAMKAKEVDVTRIEEKKKRLPRYIAVDTIKDERASPQAVRAVMIFDTQTQEIVGNDVYDVRSTPPVGGTARFETFTAEYVGTGS